MEAVRRAGVQLACGGACAGRRPGEGCAATSRVGRVGFYNRAIDYNEGKWVLIDTLRFTPNNLFDIVYTLYFER